MPPQATPPSSFFNPHHEAHLSPPLLVLASLAAVVAAVVVILIWIQTLNRPLSPQEKIQILESLPNNPAADSLTAEQRSDILHGKAVAQ